MIDPSTRVLEVFGIDGLMRAAPEVVRDLSIPETSKTFLIDVGLPKEIVLLCRFEVTSFPPLDDYARKLRSTVKPPKDLRRIGTDEGTEICLDVNRDGQIIGFSLEETIASRFINTRIELFAACLAQYVEINRRNPYREDHNDTQEELTQRAQSFASDIRDYDYLALKDSHHWWSAVVEQMEEGNL